MPYDIANALRPAQPISAFIAARDNVYSNALAKNQDARAGQESQARLAASAAQSARQTKEDAASESAMHAKVGAAAAQSVAQAPPGQALAALQMAMQGSPEIAQFNEQFKQQHGVGLEGLDDAQLRQFAGMAAQHFATQQGQGPVQPTPKVLNAGDTYGTTDQAGKFTPDYTAPPMPITPAQQLADETARRGQNLTDARSRETTYEYQVRDLPDGTKQAGNFDKQTGQWVPTGAPYKPTTGASLRPIPAATARGITINRQNLGKLDRALAALAKNPAAFGIQNYLPDAYTQRAEGKSMSGGVDARAKVADIGSLIIHDRSGAAVTISEYPRLVPFIPQMTDDPATVKTKLNNLRANLASMQDDIEASYTEESGYRPLGDNSGNKPLAAGSAPPQALEYLNAHPEFRGAFKLKYGYLPDGN